MIKNFKSDLYPYDFIVSFGETTENIHAFCLQKGGYVFICMPKYENNADWHSILAHEVSHATFFTLVRCGVTLDSPYEAYCYWNGWITKQIYLLIEKYIAKI